MTPPPALSLPLPAPLSLGGSGGAGSGAPAPPSSAIASRLRLHAAIAGISAALTELNATVESLGGGERAGVGVETEEGATLLD